MLPTKLKTLDYYLKKMTLFIRNSYGIEDQMNTTFGFLSQIDTTIDTFFTQLNLLSDTGINAINALSTTESDILDKVAAIYGLTRTFDLSYVDPITGPALRKITLTNTELQMLIKAKVVQNHYDGTYLTCKEFYENVDLPIYEYTSSQPATVEVYLDQTQGIDFTDNVVSMFLAGLFTIKSMGLKYICQTINDPVIATWDNTNRLQVFDKGVWA